MSCVGCKHLEEVYKHPWNKGAAEGSMSELFGYVCTVFPKLKDGSVGFIFFDKDRIKVGCEMFEHRHHDDAINSNTVKREE